MAFPTADKWRKIDPLNAFGSRIGRVGDMDPYILGTGTSGLLPQGGYMNGAGLDKLRNTLGVGRSQIARDSSGNLRYHPMSVGAGLPSADSMRQASADDVARRQQDMFIQNEQDAIQGMGNYEPMAKFRERIGQRGYSSGAPQEKVTRIAQNRLNQGMALNDLERLALGPSAAPEEGSRMSRRAESRDILRQRGLARGDARAAGRIYRDAMRPRNLGPGLGPGAMGFGATGTAAYQPGMPAGLAALMALGAASPQAAQGAFAPMNIQQMAQSRVLGMPIGMTPAQSAEAQIAAARTGTEAMRAGTEADESAWKRSPVGLESAAIVGRISDPNTTPQEREFLTRRLQALGSGGMAPPQERFIPPAQRDAEGMLAPGAVTSVIDQLPDDPAQTARALADAGLSRTDLQQRHDELQDEPLFGESASARQTRINELMKLKKLLGLPETEEPPVKSTVPLPFGMNPLARFFGRAGRQLSRTFGE